MLIENGIFAPARMGNAGDHVPRLPGAYHEKQGQKRGNLLCLPRGIFATKPYICGSSYFMKMMDFKKGDWCNIMDGLYWRFINRNRNFFLKNPRLSMMVRIFDKIKSDRKKLILSEAEKFINKNTI